MIELFSVNMPAEVDEPLLKTLHSGYVAQGPMVDKFELEFGRWIGNPNVVAVNSGTSALTLALRLAGVGPGDKVISTPMTCTATNLPILSLGADIVWADVDPDTGLIMPSSILELMDPSIKAIMVCDWGGTPVDLNAIMSIAKDWGIPVIEDAAHALGATYDGKMVGSIADYTCFSFQAIKHMTTVDGGMLACKDPQDAKRGRTLRWFGIDRTAVGTDSRIDQDIEDWGYKFHMNDVTATIGLVQLSHIDEFIARHRLIANIYENYLDERYERPLMGNYESSYWLYTILLPSLELRDEFKESMRQQGVQVSQVHKRNDVYSVFEKYNLNNTPGLDSFSDRMICIPINASMVPADIFGVIKVANAFAEAKF